MRVRASPAAFSLLELLTTLVLLGVVLGLAAPSASAYLQRLRVRSVLHHLTADLYHARVLAVRLGTRLRVHFEPARGCARWYLLVRSDTEQVLRRVRVDRIAPGVCLSGNVARALTVDERGMLVGSARTVHVRAGRQADSIVISMAGRVLRSE